MTQVLQVGISGASGKVGGLLAKEIQKHPHLALSSIFLRQNLSLQLAQILPQETFVTNDVEQFLAHCQLVIDFSSPKALDTLLSALLQTPLPLVCGTTGLQEQWQVLAELSQKVPVLYASNMSLGVAVLNEVVGAVAKNLEHADIEITEIHHRFKKDAPSGTALTLGQTCAYARGVDFKEVCQEHREGARKEGEIGFTSLRAGDVVGRHTVGFYLDGEYLELSHTATDRNIFAKGALEAAKWLFAQKPGLYNIQDIYRS
ncbi:4-hydroxy-tetrahydrodipicolinate reductase [Helicobacter heilmannii]|uniref:4-hydroxy-tetrahydrodipicolinate reductase n=1 Tax=Helicobacter heilmannii TaxID=35817 RepID=UPI0006A16FED|nr:4-hydroxy-tetrahydrodipicolinate reductase [Helicobacter heilmannii]